MKHCPSLECPYRRRYRRAQEYVDGAETCSDCGAVLAPGEAPAPEASSVSAGTTPHLWKRLAVTLAAPAAAFAAAHVDLPGFDPRSPGSGPLPPTDATSVVALGLMPFITASILVEIACLLVPRWRPLRISGFDGRSRIWRAVLVLALLLSIVQALGISLFLQSVDLAAHPGIASHLIAVATLVAGAFGLLGLTRVVDRHGLGNGFSVMLAGGLAGSFSKAGHRLLVSVQHGEMAPVQLLLVGGAMLVAVVATVRTSRLLAGAVSSRPTAAFRIPASGAIPITDAATLLALLGSLERWGLPGFHGVGAVFAPNSATYLATETVLALALVVLLSYLFQLPRLVAPLLERLRGQASSLEQERDRATRLLRRAIGRSALYVFVLIACGFVAGSAGAAGMAFDVVGVAVLTAVALDLVAEWRARRDNDDFVPIWPEHRVYAADVAVEALDEAEIPVFVRGIHHRVLLQFFGPFVPMDLLVPRDKEQEAKTVLVKILGPGVGPSS